MNACISVTELTPFITENTTNPTCSEEALQTAVTGRITEVALGCLATRETNCSIGGIGPRFLRVEKLEPIDYPTAAKTAKIWAKIAGNQAISMEDSIEKSRLLDCATISGMLSFSLQSASEFKEVYLCKNKSGEIEAMMLIASADFVDCISIRDLVTHPSNILHPIGAGTALIRCAERLANERGMRGIELTPLHFATSFYEKMGFQHSGAYSMTKTIN